MALLRKVLKEANQLIAEESLELNIPMDKKTRRRQPKSEKQKLLKRDRYRDNTQCLLCKENADKKEAEVLQTRRACLMEDAKAPPALRIHMACLQREGYTQVAC